MSQPIRSWGQHRSNNPGYTDYQKIHKPTTPLRLIVSCIGSFAYHLSKHLAEILSPLTGASEHTVPNSSGFAEFIAEQTICESETIDILRRSIPLHERTYRGRMPDSPTSHADGQQPNSPHHSLSWASHQAPRVRPTVYILPL